MYEEDIEEVARYTFVPLVVRPFYHAVAKWIRQQGNSYELVKKYVVLFGNSNRFTIDLYVKQPSVVLVGSVAGSLALLPCPYAVAKTTIKSPRLCELRK